MHGSLFMQLSLLVISIPISLGFLHSDVQPFSNRLNLRQANSQIAASTAAGVENEGSNARKRTQTPPARKRTQTHRSTAVFAMMEGAKRKSMFAIRRLENDPDYLALDRRDRAFARLMLTTAERRQGQIDKVLKAFMNKHHKFKQNQGNDMLCQATLRMGAAQLLYLDTPSYAVLKETVEVLRMHPKIEIAQSQVKFVNAVLRSIDREGRLALEKTSVFDNIEPWLAKEWKETYGEEKAKLIAEASMSQSPIFISVNHPPESSDEERAEKLNFVKDQFSAFNDAELLPHGSIRVPPNHAGSVAAWPLFDEGDWWVQDASASLPAIALYKGLMTGGRRAGDLHVVDLCCAPGGKTAQLCASGFGKISAVEISSRRIKPLADNLERLKMKNRCEVIVADGSEWVSDEAIDGVLVDAPCSATGVGSRRPDVLRRSPDISELTDMQRRLAVHTVDNLLKPGGIMVYATCSLLKQESEDQMKSILSRSSGAVMETVPFTAGEIPGFDEAIDENGWLRVLPGVLPGSLGNCDGFFVARLRRVK